MLDSPLFKRRPPKNYGITTFLLIAFAIIMLIFGASHYSAMEGNASMSISAFLHDFPLVFPLFIANAVVLVVMRAQLLGPLHKLDRPISEKYLGRHKTWLGSLVIFASVVAIYLALSQGLLIYPALGMVIGTRANSFLKRVFRIPPGDPFPPFDQLDYFAGGVAGLALSGIYLQDAAGIAFITFFMHLFGNIFCYVTGIKDVWW